MTRQWEPGPVVAWTETDGPGRVPPTPARWAAAAAATSLAVAALGILTASTVCPEHTLWIDVVASFVIVLAVTAAVATVKGSVAGPLLVLGASSAGVAIPAVGLAHDVTRAGVVFCAFAVAGLASAFTATRLARLRSWEARVRADAVASAEVARRSFDGAEVGEPAPARS